MGALRQTLRTLRRRPLFFVTAVATLGFGIGGCTLLFSAVHAALLRPLSYPEADRLAVLWGVESSEGRQRSQLSFPEILDYRRDSEVFEEVAAFTEYRPLLTTQDRSERLAGGLVSDGFFRVLGVVPERGRFFLPEEQQEGRDDVVVLTHGLWVRRFGGDPGIVGTAVRVNLREHLVVGVLPATFEPLPSSLMDERPDLYRPAAESADEEQRDARHLRAIARLRPGVGIEQAQAAAEVVAARLVREYPEDHAGRGVRVASLEADAVDGYRTILLVLLAAVALVLVVACTNVALVVQARLSQRQRELAVRTALGASRARLALGQVLESGLLVAGGAAVGLGLSAAGSGLLRSLGDRYPLLERASMEPAVFGFALLVSALSVGVLSLSPAFRASRTQPADALCGGGRVTGGRARRLIVATQVAVAVLLLAGASLTLRSLWRLAAVDPGFDLSGKLTAGVWLPYAAYRDPAKRIAFFDRLLSEVEALPGVEAAAVTSVLPLGSNFDRTSVELQDHVFAPGEEPSPDRYAVSPGYLEMMGIRRLRGRGIEEGDREGAQHVVVVSESLAAQLWPGEDPLGRQLRLPFSPADTNPWREVVGIVADVRQYGLDRSATPALYVPEAQYPFSYVTLVASTHLTPESLVAPLVRTAREIDPDQALFDLRTGDQYLRQATLGRRLPGAVLAVLAAVVLAVAGVGLFGVVALGVAERTREIGIRLTLGARQWDIRRAVLGDTFEMVGLGLAAGLLAAWPMTRLLRGLLFGVEPHDPASLVLATVVLVATSLLASWVPLRRAGRVEPMEVLRYD